MEIPRGYTIAILAALTLLALAFRASDLDAAGFAEDEINKLAAARAYLRGDFLQNLEHPMLMKLLVAASVAAADAWNAASPEARVSEEAAVRLPNAAAGAAMTLAVFALARLYFGTGVGLAAAALWSTGVLAIAINRTAKEDTLLILFAWLAFYYYERAKRLGAADTPKQRRLFLVAGACCGLMMASKYLAPQFWGLLFLFYYLVGTDDTNRPLTRSAYAAFNGAFVASFLLFNPVVLHPAAWTHFLAYVRAETVTHHGYVMMGRIYENTFSVSANGLPVYFYPLMLLVKTPLPVLAAAAVGTVVAVRRRHERGAFFLLLVCVTWLVGYSLPAGKWMRYLLALMPAFYTLAALGVVVTCEALGRRVASGAARRAAVVAAALVLLAAPAAVAAASAPYFSLYLNAAGGGRVAWFFPHDELYDAGLREAVACVAREAPPGAVVLGEAPPVLEYYAGRFGRADLRFVEMSEPPAAGPPEPAHFAIVQPGRVYFENADLVARLEAAAEPADVVRVAGAVAARVYRLGDAAGAEGAP